MSLEIERRWLVSPQKLNDLSLDGVLSQAEIHQGYLSKPEDSLVLRVRRVDVCSGARALAFAPITTSYIETLKMTQLGQRWPQEFEHSLPSQVGEGLLAAARARLEKTRYCIPHGAQLIELDVFKGPLAPLVIAEIELGSPTESVLVPEWFGREITHDKAYANINLAWYGLPDGFSNE